MKSLRRWKLDSSMPFTLHLAADARLSQTRYLDDQSWEVLLGGVDQNAVVLRSVYGGRVKVATLVPAVELGGRRVYLTQAFHTPAVITAFAPGYAQLEAALSEKLGVRFEFWVMESQAIGGRMTFANRDDNPVTLRPQLSVDVDASPHRMPLANLPLARDRWGLSLGRQPGFEPVLLLENGQPDVRGTREREHFIATELTVAAGQRASVRWCHAGLESRAASAARAAFWLEQSWDVAFAAIQAAYQALPEIETGDEALDAALTFSAVQLVQAFLRPTDHLPGASFVASRQPGRGHSKRGDGTDYGRGWDGQNPHLAYVIAQSIATIHPEFARNMIDNYLAVQGDDGAVDMQPGLGGQREGLLCPPLLARMAWGIYEVTRELTYIQRVFPGLLRFFNRWFEVDLDVDLDIIPEWQDIRQTGYIFWPTFAAGQSWSLALDIRRVETPDLASYLLSEAEALRKMAKLLDDPGAYELDGRIHRLLGRLETMWYPADGRYAYQDRDTGITSSGADILRDGQGDEGHILAYRLKAPSRVIVTISGGTRNAPSATLYMDGLDADGNEVREVVPLEEFDWRYSGGSFTSRQVYTSVDRVRVEGLSRVFKIDLQSADYTREDINAYLPLIVESLSEERAVALIDRLVSADRFMRENGLTIVAADDPAFDPSSANGGGGTWVYWTALMAEGLIAHDRLDLAAELVGRLVAAQVTTLKDEKAFAEFYHSDDVRGLGELPYLTGIIAPGIFLRVSGAQILDHAHVRAGGPFVWERPLTVRQHGVTVERSAGGTRIDFPSGNQVTLEPDAAWQLVVDPTAASVEAPAPINAITPPEHASPPAANRVIIEVIDEDDPEGSA